MHKATKTQHNRLKITSLAVAHRKNKTTNEATKKRKQVRRRCHKQSHKNRKTSPQEMLITDYNTKYYEVVKTKTSPQEQKNGHENGTQNY